MKQGRGTHRRSWLKLVAGAIAAGAIAAPAVASAQGQVVVGTWGGDYAQLLNKNIEQPFLIPEGWEVIQDQAGDPERRAKMLAERRLPRGTTDVQGLNGPNMFQVHELGITQEIDYSRIPNAENLLPSMKEPYGVGHIYSAMVPVYNPDMVEEAPDSYADVFDPKWGDKLGIIDIQYQYTLMAAALAPASRTFIRSSWPFSRSVTVPPAASAAAMSVYWYWMSMMPSLSPHFGSKTSA